jgi:hypothetical protein
MLSQRQNNEGKKQLHNAETKTTQLNVMVICSYKKEAKRMAQEQERHTNEP